MSETLGCKIVCADYHTICLDNYGDVWVSGGNSKGQLGIENTEGIDSFTQINFQERICNVTAGLQQSLCITESGKVFAFGTCSHNQLGLHSGATYLSDKKITIPTQVDLSSQKIVEISSSQYHTLFLTDTNEVYSTGDGKFSSIQTHVEFTAPKNLDLPVKISMIAAGKFHSVFLDTNGLVWTCGVNITGQCGRRKSKIEVIANISPIKNLRNIASIASGYDHTLCLDRDGVVFGFGKNNHGELGQYNVEPQFIPIKIIDNISKISCGNNHSFFIDNSQYLHGCGSNIYGQLGLGSEVKSQLFVTRIPILNQISTISSGGLSTFCIDIEGIIWAFGNNFDGQLGIGEQQSTYESPFEVKDPHIISMFRNRNRAKSARK